MLHFALLLSKEISSDIIGITRLHTKFDVFWTKNCCPYYNSLVECVQIGTTFYSICGFTCRAGVHLPPYCLIISVCDGGSKPPPYDLFGYAALACGICDAFSIFSIKIP